MDFANQKKRLEPILKHPKNHLCADFNAVSPTWASLDFGVFLCSSCSGAHRGLGPTITRVKSANLDLWEEEWYRNMVIGNEKLNAYWQSNSLCMAKKPKSGASNMQIGRYVYEKYIKKKYVKNLQEQDPLTIYKNNNYSFSPLKEKQDRKEYIQPQKTETHSQKIEKVQAKVLSAASKKVQNLIDFEQERQIKQEHPSLLLAANQIQQFQLQVNHNYSQNNASARYSQIGTSFTTENSKDDFISFDQLLKAQKKGQTTLHHSLSTQQVNKPSVPLASNFYHPYNPILGQQNLVYNSYYHPSSNQYQLNIAHSHSPQPQASHVPLQAQYPQQNFVQASQYTNLPQNTTNFNWL